MNREDFPMLKQNIIYLDNGATTFKPQCVIDKMNDYYTKYTANAHRGDYRISNIVNQEYESTRDLVKDFLNASSREEIIFTSGTTESLNMVANGYFKDILDDKSEILITKAEHASLVLPFFVISQNIGCQIKYLDLNLEQHLSLDAVKEAVNPNTKVIAIAQISNVLGDLRPIKEICEFAHANGITVVVDGAQSAGHIPVDVQELDCDFYTFSAHKMLGPTGVGVLYGKKSCLENLQPLSYGGGITMSFDSEREIILKDIPYRFEPGTPNISGVIGLGEAIKYINGIGIEKISEHENKLRKYCLEQLNTISHIEILNENSDNGIISFNVKGVFAQDVAIYLDQQNICVRAGDHCAKILKDITNVKNSCRISFYIYNNVDEINKLITFLKTEPQKILEGAI